MTFDHDVRIGNKPRSTECQVNGMDDLRGDLASPDASWPGWWKAACLLVTCIAAWASVLVPAIYFLG
jgi:hypothetical protein